MCFLIALVGVSFAEVAVTVLLTKYWGALFTYSLFAIPTVLGLFIQWQRKDRMKEAWDIWQRAYRGKEKHETLKMMSRIYYAAAQAELQTFWMSVFLLAIPGPFTAVIAFCLMAPVVKKRITRMIQDTHQQQRAQLYPKTATEPDDAADASALT